jgi:hypothetical protein
VGCGRCEKFAHSTCAKDLACPECAQPLLDGNALYKIDSRGKLGFRTQAAGVGDEALSRAMAGLAAGASKDSIERDLRSAGTSDEIAAEFAQSLSDARRSAGRKMAIQGGLICLGGAVGTVATYAVAPGGRFVLFWGAIIFGAIRMFRGLSLLR